MTIVSCQTLIITPTCPNGDSEVMTTPPTNGSLELTGQFLAVPIDWVNPVRDLEYPTHSHLLSWTRLFVRLLASLSFCHCSRTSPVICMLGSSSYIFVRLIALVGKAITEAMPNPRNNKSFKILKSK